MRRVILMRHGHAEPYRTDDFSRRLTAHGFEQARRSALTLREQGIRPALVLASPAARTRETAEVLLQVMELSAQHLREDARLYLADVTMIETVLAEQAPTEQGSGELLLVGHNPGLSMLANVELEPADFRILAN